jgi:hypothetical protein
VVAAAAVAAAASPSFISKDKNIPVNASIICPGSKFLPSSLIYILFISSLK